MNDPGIGDQRKGAAIDSDHAITVIPIVKSAVGIAELVTQSGDQSAVPIHQVAGEELLIGWRGPAYQYIVSRENQLSALRLVGLRYSYFLNVAGVGVTSSIHGIYLIAVVSVGQV